MSPDQASLTATSRWSHRAPPLRAQIRGVWGPRVLCASPCSPLRVLNRTPCSPGLALGTRDEAGLGRQSRHPSCWVTGSLVLLLKIKPGAHATRGVEAAFPRDLWLGIPLFSVPNSGHGSPYKGMLLLGSLLFSTAGTSLWRCWALFFSLGHRGQQSWFPWGSPTPLPSPILRFAHANPLLCTCVSVVGSDGSGPG